MDPPTVRRPWLRGRRGETVGETHGAQVRLLQLRVAGVRPGTLPGTPQAQAGGHPLWLRAGQQHIPTIGDRQSGPQPGFGRPSAHPPRQLGAKGGELAEAAAEGEGNGTPVFCRPDSARTSAPVRVSVWCTGYRVFPTRRHTHHPCRETLVLNVLLGDRLGSDGEKCSGRRRPQRRQSFSADPARDSVRIRPLFQFDGHRKEGEVRQAETTDIREPEVLGTH